MYPVLKKFYEGKEGTDEEENQSSTSALVQTRAANWEELIGS